ncbi:unnamed protein product [Prorocentrum cordatum]|uniref:RRM domain-containing protein n=1 Tax=Prorocentrum cordatum TaxID=2364126 RepID=A0ABN9UU92_9DINO|nr:unnamed protein product [Polarella glacialis]
MVAAALQMESHTIDGVVVECKSYNWNAESSKGKGKGFFQNFGPRPNGFVNVRPGIVVANVAGAPAPRPVMRQQQLLANKLFVGGLSPMTTNETLGGTAADFSQFGQADCIVMLDRFTGRSRGFGFCTFPTPEEAQRAMNGGQPNNFGGTDHVIDGKATSAKFCEAKQDWGSAPPQAPQVIVARPQVIVARPQVITARPQVQYVTAAQPDPAAANMAMLAAEPAGGYGGAVSSAAPVQQLVQVVQAPQGGQQYAVDYQQQVPQQQAADHSASRDVVTRYTQLDGLIRITTSNACRIASIGTPFKSSGEPEATGAATLRWAEPRQSGDSRLDRVYSSLPAPPFADLTAGPGSTLICALATHPLGSPGPITFAGSAFSRPQSSELTTVVQHSDQLVILFFAQLAWLDTVAP